jgi:hypothetical protein
MLTFSSLESEASLAARFLKGSSFAEAKEKEEVRSMKEENKVRRMKYEV